MNHGLLTGFCLFDVLSFLPSLSSLQRITKRVILGPCREKARPRCSHIQQGPLVPQTGTEAARARVVARTVARPAADAERQRGALLSAWPRFFLIAESLQDFHRPMSLANSATRPRSSSATGSELSLHRRWRPFRFWHSSTDSSPSSWFSCSSTRPRSRSRRHFRASFRLCNSRLDAPVEKLLEAETVERDHAL